MKQHTIYQQYMYSYPHKKAYYAIEANRIEDSIKNLTDEELTLYLHVPFCSSKCGYCNLFSIPTQHTEMLASYVEAVKRQIKQVGSLLPQVGVGFRQLVIGGGTPLMLNIRQMEMIFEYLEAYLPFQLSKVQFAIETSPKETTLEKLTFLKEKGINRMSIGVQSFFDEELQSIYRKHDVASCKQALEQIKKVGVDSLNIDLIYGIKGQTLESLKASIIQAVAYEPEEIFLYPLYIREDTQLFQKMEVDEALQYKMYQQAAYLLNQKGYSQTSMRRFVKQLPKETLSCGFEQMLALGCGGRSYIGNLHFCEPYVTQVKESKKVLENFIEKVDFTQGLKGYELNKEEMERRVIIKNLGYYQGIDLEAYTALFYKDIFETYPFLKDLLEKGLCEIREGRLKLSDEGRGKADGILGLWISPEVKERMRE